MSSFAPSLDTGAVIIDDASAVPECGYRSHVLAETRLADDYGEAAQFYHVASHRVWCLESAFLPPRLLFASWGEAETWLAHRPPALVASCHIEPYG